MLDYISWGLLIFNGLTVTTVGWLYIAYFKNLNSSLKAKDEQIKTTEKNLLFWKDKASDLEKKTPEYIEEVLAKRIKHREEEIKRLDSDNTENLKLIESKSKALSLLRKNLEQTTNLNRALTYYDFDSEEEIVIPESEISIIELGEVAVDSGSLLITDPSYINDEWNKDIDFEDIRLYKHIETKRIYQYHLDFQIYSEIIEGFDKSVNELISDKILIPIEINQEYSYSYGGSSNATLSKDGYGELVFKMGHKGAGISIKTVYGDGYYRVYGEKYKDEIVRIYIDLE